MIIAFKICKEEASFWNCFVFYVHCITTYWWTIRQAETGYWNI